MRRGGHPPSMFHAAEEVGGSYNRVFGDFARIRINFFLVRLLYNRLIEQQAC